MPTFLLLDEARLSQVLVNLVGNAIKFTHVGSVTVSILNNGATKDGKNKVLFKVKDTGVGIDDKKLSTIFKAFEQADISDTRKYGGTGLGLSISSQIVRLMGGEISVTSKLQQGSEFSFELTAQEDSSTCQKETQSLSKKEINKKLLSKLKILIAEDNIINQKVAQSMLASIGGNADLAQTGLEAVKLSEKNNYDIIFMDYHMPELNGIEATKIIRKTNQEVKIIAMTASALAETKAECREAGMDAFLTKPLTAKELEKIIFKTLNS